MTLTEYARRSLEEAARRPSRDELVAKLSAIEPVTTGETAADALARIRNDLE
jgi:hypothetical protein